MVETPLKIEQSEVDGRIPFLNSFQAADTKITQAEELLDVKVLYFNRPTLTIEIKYRLSIQCGVGGQKILRVFVTPVPFTNQNTDLKWDVLESSREGANEIGLFSRACSGRVDPCVPLVLETLVPSRELSSIEQSIRLDGANYMPPLPTTQFQ